MSTETDEAPRAAGEQAQLHGGRLIARRLKAHGVSRLFTLSGGHLFSIYDGCREEGIELVDVRHEATAAGALQSCHVADLRSSPVRPTMVDPQVNPDQSDHRRPSATRGRAGAAGR